MVTSAMLELATKTVFAGAGSRIRVPLLASSTIGGPLGDTWIARDTGSASGAAGTAVARPDGLTTAGPFGPTIKGPGGPGMGGGAGCSCAPPKDGINNASAATATIGNLCITTPANRQS